MLTIIRGLPGSGKTSLAKQLLKSMPIGTGHFEADMYFDLNGEYNFDIGKLNRAHMWCQDRVFAVLNRGNHCIVSNTFTTERELRIYFEINRETTQSRPNVILCQSNYGTIHDVPAETIEKMRKRFAYDLTNLYKEFGYE